MNQIPASDALAELRRIQKETFLNVQRNIGWLRRMGRRGVKVFRKGPRTEIAHDWLMVNGFANMVQENLPTEGTIPGSFISALAMIRAYLELARYERDFAQAWSYVNLATTLLTRVVDENDLRVVTFRLRCYPPKKEDEDKDDNAADKDKEKEKKKKKQDEPTAEQLEEKPLDRYELYRRQLGEAQKWNARNRIVSLKQSLWRFIGFCLFSSLVVAISVAEAAFFYPDLFKQEGPFRFIAVALLGFFGGGLSAFLKARDEAINFSNCGLIKTHTVLRMLLGAAGSFVVYLLVLWMPVTDMAKTVNESFPTFLSLGIAAGFSERLFINALEKVTKNLKLSADDDSPKNNGDAQNGEEK